jgi:hypothetical protein
VMNSTCSTRRTRVSADGDWVVLHAGAARLRETADYTGLVAAVTAALADTYGGRGCTPRVGCSSIWWWRWPSIRWTGGLASGRRPPQRRAPGVGAGPGDRLGRGARWRTAGTLWRLDSDACRRGTSPYLGGAR